MAAQGEPPLIDPDAEELVFKLRLNSIPSREATTLLMPSIVAMGFMLSTVSLSSFICISSLPTVLYYMVTRLVIRYFMYSILYSYK